MTRYLLIVFAALAFAGCEPKENGVSADMPPAQQKPTKIQIIENGSLKPRPKPQKPLKPRSAEIIENINGINGTVADDDRPSVEENRAKNSVQP